jgi:Mg2+ and Co2+ transporter CorA
MGLLFSDNRKELKEKNATVGTQALRNKVLEKRAADMEELRLEVERLKRNLQDATAESGRALKRVGDLQEEVVAYMEVSARARRER